MALETGTFISDLDAANPAGTDPKSQGDDHIRLLKSALKATFPNVAGEVTPSHVELNHVDGVTSSIQAQLDTLGDEKGDKAGETWSGAHDFTGATVSFPGASFAGVVTGVTASPGDDSTKFATTEFVNQAAFQAALPNQAGSAGKFLTTDGAGAVWQYTVATEVEAEAGVANASLMTPERTAQAIAELAPRGSAPDVIVEDQRPAGTDGQTLPEDTWTKRDLNTLVHNKGGLASLSSGALTLPAGTYRIEGWCVVSSGTFSPAAISRIRNVTANTIISTSNGARGDPGPNLIMFLPPRVVTFAASTTIELQTRPKNHSQGGLAVDNDGTNELYACMTITNIFE